MGIASYLALVCYSYPFHHFLFSLSFSAKEAAQSYAVTLVGSVMEDIKSSLASSVVQMQARSSSEVSSLILLVADSASSHLKYLTRVTFN